MAKWTTAPNVKCRTQVTLVQAKKQWSRITRHMLTAEARKAMTRPKWAVDEKGRPSATSRDGRWRFETTCHNGNVSFTWGQ